ncbi:MAG: Gfo/Idh/MocA family oxidoreductase [Verrucomicrobiota bacterium]|nr:Gfo/Idh/MocA family oxidoreductase [Verrucomicrobiota bacterium]
MKKIIVGICGAGGFAENFIPLFKAHPLVAEVRIAELRPDRRAEIARRYSLTTVYSNHTELFASDVDAVCIFTERVKHVPYSIQALRSGKHVYSAVPAAGTLEELHDLVETVKQTGQVYMMGETSIYYPSCIYCRKQFQEGKFGKFVYGEGEYYHDMAEKYCSFYDIYQKAHGAQWRQYAGFPPMLYPTHSVAMVLSPTGARMEKVSCFGYDDTNNEDLCWGKGRNFWDNPFSSQSALFRTSDGGMARINEFRRVGIGPGNSVRLSLFGTKAVFEEQSGESDGVISMTTHAWEKEDIKPLLACAPASVGKTAANEEKSELSALAISQNTKEEEAVSEAQQKLKTSHRDGFYGVSLVHEIGRLPSTFKGLHNGHYGSHQFLVDDFVKACAWGKLPPNNVWDAARYNAPGIVAHQSSLREGELLSIPDFGSAPVDNLLDPYAVLL